MATTSSSTAVTLSGFNPTDGEAIKDNIILTVPLEESQTISKGDFLTVSTAGYWQKNASNKAKIKGIAWTDATSTATETSGEQKCSVLVWGIILVDALVQDTNLGSGYDGDIDVGQVIFAAGDGGTLCDDGQAVVAGDGTETVTSNAMGICFDSCDGSDDEDLRYNVRILFDGISNVV